MTVLRLTAEGTSPKTIATRLGLSIIHGVGIYATELWEAGRLARFDGFHCGVNHSCVPNIVHVAWIVRGIESAEEWNNLYLPSRTIRAGEELTIDYRSFGGSVPRRCGCPRCVAIATRGFVVEANRRAASDRPER